MGKLFNLLANLVNLDISFLSRMGYYIHTSYNELRGIHKLNKIENSSGLWHTVEVHKIYNRPRVLRVFRKSPKKRSPRSRPRKTKKY